MPSELFNILKEADVDDFSSFPSLAAAFKATKKDVISVENSSDPIERVRSFITSRTAVRSSTYFEHFISHAYDHTNGNIFDVNYYMSLSANSMNYYKDQNFDPSIDHKHYSDHFMKLFSIPFDSYIPELVSNPGVQIPFENDFVFPGIRYISDNFVIFELPPGMRHISYQEQYRDYADGKNYKEFYIPVPWQIYVAQFSPEKRLVSVQMYFSKTPLYSMDQVVYCPPMFNFYSNGMLCRPFFESMEDYEKYPKTISGVVASAFDWIWNSGFNLDIVETLYEFIQSKNYLSLAEQATNKDISNHLAFLNSVENHSFYNSHGINASVSLELISSIFKIWQEVPIENILNVNWNPFCVSGSFFHHGTSHYVSQFFSSEVAAYAADRGLIYYENEDDVPHEEDENGDWLPVSDDYVTPDSLFSNLSFRKYILPYIYKIDSPISSSLKIMADNSPYFTNHHSSSNPSKIAFETAIATKVSEYLS